MKDINIKKFVLTILTLMLIIMNGFTSLISSYADDVNGTCSSECNFDDSFNLHEEFIGFRVIEGEIYIDFLIEQPDDMTTIDNNHYSTMNAGKCPVAEKKEFKRISKDDLIILRNKTSAYDNLTGDILIFVLNQILPYSGDLLGTFMPVAKGPLVRAIDDALENRDEPGKTKFTIRTILKCVESVQGSRGIVHSYKVDSYYIW